MLKIKDDVDLKELENFGFTYDSSYSYFSYYSKFLGGKEWKLFISCTSRLITLSADLEIGCDNTSDFDVIYDLISAGLVEKV